nr:MAG TPA: hypothetical protein [Microviridae sp.]
MEAASAIREALSVAGMGRLLRAGQNSELSRNRYPVCLFR